MNQLIHEQLYKIKSYERLRELLELRIFMLRRNFSGLDEFHKNETEIRMIMTVSQIEEIEPVINATKHEAAWQYAILIAQIEKEA